MFNNSVFQYKEKALKRIKSSIEIWFFALLLLNIVDVLITTPAYEANPVTLFLWGRIGVFLSASLKIGVVLLFGGLYQLTKIVATPTEWAFSKKLFGGILVVLVAFYTFVVAWNAIIFGLVNL